MTADVLYCYVIIQERTLGKKLLQKFGNGKPVWRAAVLLYPEHVERAL